MTETVASTRKTNSVKKNYEGSLQATDGRIEATYTTTSTTTYITTTTNTFPTETTNTYVTTTTTSLTEEDGEGVIIQLGTDGGPVYSGTQKGTIRFTYEGVTGFPETTLGIYHFTGDPGGTVYSNTTVRNFSGTGTEQYIGKATPSQLPGTDDPSGRLGNQDMTYVTITYARLERTRTYDTTSKYFTQTTSTYDTTKTKTYTNINTTNTTLL